MCAGVRVRSSSGTSTSIPSYPASPARPHSTLKSLFSGGWRSVRPVLYIAALLLVARYVFFDV